jgi:hypothetical protein
VSLLDGPRRADLERFRIPLRIPASATDPHAIAELLEDADVIHAHAPGFPHQGDILGNALKVLGKKFPWFKPTSSVSFKIPPKTHGPIFDFSFRGPVACKRLGVLAANWISTFSDGKARLIATYVNHDNSVRLHSAIGYITPHDKLLGKEKAIFAARDQKLAQARRQRKIKRQNQPAQSLVPQSDFSN